MPPDNPMPVYDDRYWNSDQWDPLDYGKDYDFAPGSLLVSEAGGVVANIGKTTYDYRNLNFIASNRPVFTALTEGAGALFPIQ